MKLGIFSTHPIQYQVPLWRELASTSDWETTVYYFSDQGIGQSVDPGFNEVVTWDVPLLDGYQHEFLSKRPVNECDSFCIPKFNKFMSERRLDVTLLHGYTHKFARQIIRGRQKFGYQVILRGEFTEMPRRAYSWKSLARTVYLKWFYQHVDHFCPIGVDATEHLGKYGIDKSKVTLAPYSVDDQLFENKSKVLNKRSCRDQLGLGHDDIVFLFSGKMIPRKQPLRLAEAILKIVNQYPKLAVIYVGSGPQLEETRQLLASRLGDKLVMPGFVNQSELGMYFKAADVFVLPSTYDTWGLVVNEAMHFGLPCIVSDMVGSRRDLVRNGETGWIFHHESSNELAACLQRFLDEPKLTKSMGVEAHDLIQSYSISNTVQGIKKALSIVSLQAVVGGSSG